MSAAEEEAPAEFRRQMLAGLTASGLDLRETWMMYMSLGGMKSEQDLQAYFSGEVSLSRHETNLVVAALNEALLDKGQRASVDYLEL